MKPLRSALYMPGSNGRALEKAKSLPADALILDLEDAVAPDAKVAAREQVCAAVTSGAYGSRLVAVRVNGLNTEWHADDVAAVAAAGPAAIVVPKVNSADDVHSIEAELEAAGGAGPDLNIWAMIETPAAVLAAAAIAAASPRLTTLVLGTNDLLNELRAKPTPDRVAVLPFLQQVILAARAAGKTVLDGVYNDVKDELGFVAEAHQARVLGFDGKTLIHPGQVEPANEIFAPSAEDVEHAHAVIAAFDDALAQGRGIATLNGRIVENLHVADARRVLAFAEAIATSA